MRSTLKKCVESLTTGAEDVSVLASGDKVAWALDLAWAREKSRPGRQISWIAEVSELRDLCRLN
jgi:hypothetical protein